MLNVRKLRRWTFAVIAIASLVLCLATVGLWVRSYWAADFAGRYDGRGGIYALISHTGSIHFDRQHSGYGDADGFYYGRDKVDRWTFHTSILTFFWQSHANGKSIVFPHWSLALLFAVVPTWWGMAIVRARHRLQPGCCANCGYDLRASPGRCPECGIPQRMQCEG